MMLFMYALLTCIYALDANAIQSRVNYGIIFRRTQNFELVTDHWLHTFSLPLPTVTYDTALPDFCVNISETSSRSPLAVTCTRLRPLLSTLSQLMNRSTGHLQSVMGHVDALMPQWTWHTGSKLKRGLGSWLGSGISWTFGLAQQSDVDALKHSVRHVAHNIDVALNSWQKLEGDMKSYTVLNNERVTNLANAMNDTQIVVSLLEHQISRSRSEFSAMQPVVDAIVRKLISYISFEDDFIMLYTALSDLLHSRLSPILVPHEMLQHVLNNVRDDLYAINPRYRLLRHMASDYYRMSDFLLTKHDHRLYVTLRLPITTRSPHFELFKIETFPVNVPDNPTLATVLKDPPFAIAVPTRLPIAYIVFQTAEQVNIVEGMFDISISDVSLLPYAYKHCITALYRDMIRDVNDFCTFSVIRRNLQPSVIHLLDNRVLLSNVPTVQLNCGRNDVRNSTGCELCVFHIPCGCALFTPYTIVQATFSSCSDTPDNITMLHGLNLIVLQQFFEPEQLGSLLGSTLLDSSIETDLPVFRTYENDQKHRLAADEKYKYNLLKLANLTKHDTIAFHSLADALRHELKSESAISEATYIETIKSWQLWLFIGTLIIAACAVVFTFHLWLKVRYLTACLITLGRLPSAHAQIPTYLSYFTTTVPAPTVHSGIASSESSFVQCSDILYVAMSVALILLFLMFVMLVYRQLTSHFCRGWTFCLNIGNENENVLVDIQTLPNHPYCYSLSAVTFVKSMKIEGHVSPKLLIEWPTLKILFWPNSTIMQMRAFAKLSFSQTRQLGRILLTDFWCLPVGKVHNRLTFLAVHKVSDRVISDSDVYGTIPAVGNSENDAPRIPQANTLYPDLSTESTM